VKDYVVKAGSHHVLDNDQYITEFNCTAVCVVESVASQHSSQKMASMKSEPLIHRLESARHLVGSLCKFKVLTTCHASCQRMKINFLLEYNISSHVHYLLFHCPYFILFFNKMYRGKYCMICFHCSRVSLLTSFRFLFMLVMFFYPFLQMFFSCSCKFFSLAFLCFFFLLWILFFSCSCVNYTGSGIVGVLGEIVIFLFLPFLSPCCSLLLLQTFEPVPPHCPLHMFLQIFNCRCI